MGTITLTGMSHLQKLLADLQPRVERAMQKALNDAARDILKPKRRRKRASTSRRY